MVPLSKKNLYELQFYVEKNVDDDSPEPMDMDNVNGKDDQQHEGPLEKDKELPEKHEGKRGTDQEEEVRGPNARNSSAPAKQAIVGRATGIARWAPVKSVVEQSISVAVVVVGRATGPRPVYHLRIPAFTEGDHGLTNDENQGELGHLLLPQEGLPSHIGTGTSHAQQAGLDMDDTLP